MKGKVKREMSDAERLQMAWRDYMLAKEQLETVLAFEDERLWEHRYRQLGHIA